MSALKVLYIDPTQGTGGATSTLLAMVKCLDHGEIKPFLLQHLEGPANKDFIRYGVRILPRKIGLTRAIMFDPYLGSNCRNVAIKKVIKFLGMIIKYLNLYTVIFLDYFRIISAAIKHHIDIVHVNSHRQVYLPLGFICKFFKTSVIFHVRYLTKPPPYRYHWFAGFVSFFFVSKFVESYYLSTGITPKFVAVLYDGRFTDEFKDIEIKENHKKLKHIYAIPLHHKIIINISTLSRGKGQHAFVKAASLVSRAREDVTFLVVGDNVPYEDDIKSELSMLISEYHLEERVLLLGQRTDIPALLAQSDISVVSTELPEALCGVNIEAMAVGVPVVSTNVGAIPEVVVPGETGLLVPPGDYEKMAEAILRLLNNADEARNLAQRGHERFLNLFNAEVNTARLCDYYRAIAGGSTLPA